MPTRAAPVLTRPRGSWVTIPLLLLGFIVSGLMWAYASPLGASPDEDFHATTIWCPMPIETSGCELVRDASGTVVGAMVPATVAMSSGCYAFHPEESGAACLSTLRDDQLVPTDRLNTGLYPGPYYQVMHLFVSRDVTASILFMRAFNVVLAGLVLGGLIAIASSATKRALAIAWVASLVPLGIYVTASINPSSWAFVGVTGTWMALHTLLQTRSRRTAVGAAALGTISTAMAATSRTDAGAFVLLATVVMVVLHSRELRRLGWRAAGFGIPVIAGVWSFLSGNQTQILQGAWAKREVNPIQLLAGNLAEFPSLIGGLFGVGWGVGWLDTNVPAMASIGSITTAAGLLFIGMQNVQRRKMLALVTVCGAIVGLILLTLQVAQTLVGAAIQPRYLLPLLPLAIGVAILAEPPTQTVRVGPLPSLTMWLFLTAGHSTALFALIRRHVTGNDVLDIRLGHNAEWWWTNPILGPIWVWVIGSLAFALVTLVFLAPFEPSRPAGASRGWGLTSVRADVVTRTARARRA